MVSPFTVAWQALLVVAFAITGIRYISARYPERRDVFLMFGTLMGLIVSERISPLVGGSAGEAIGVIAAGLLLAHPYALLRVVDHLRPVRQRAMRAVLAGFLVSWVVLTISAAPRPMPLTIFVASYFAASEVYASYLLLQGSRTSAGATEYRLLFASAGSFLLGAALFMAFGWTFLPLSPDVASGAIAWTIIGGFVAFFIGFAPPRRLTQIWDLRTLHEIIELAPREGSLSERTDRSLERFLNAVEQLAEPEAYVFAAARGDALEVRYEPAVLNVPEIPIQEATVLKESMEKGEIVRARDLSAYSDWERRAAERVQAKEIVAIPLSRGRQAEGGCLLFLREIPLFNEQTATFLQLLGAEDIGQALHVEDLARRRERGRVRALEREKAALEEADRLKDEFLATMSHEIRTPINALLGSVDLMHYSGVTEEQQKHLETIETSGDHLLMLIDDILNLSKIEAGEVDLNPQDVVLEPFLSSCVDLGQERAQDKGIELTSTIEPGSRQRVRMDPDRVRQIVTNLVTNAIKFTGDGYVHVRATTLEQDDEPVLQLEVEDTGIGIPPDKQDVIFEPFQQADPSSTREHEGTGLGLAICKRLTDMMNGDIHVESTVGEGTTFRIQIPVQTPRGPPAETAAPRIPNATAKDGSLGEVHPMDVLIVEDNEVNLRVATAMLQELGYDPDTATNGRDGLDKIHDGAYDIVFLDLRMPGMDGFQVARRIREEIDPDNQPWLVALTAHEGSHYREKARRAGTDSYLAKPVRSEDLAREIETLAHASHAERIPPTPAPPGDPLVGIRQRREPNPDELQMLDEDFLEEMEETMPPRALEEILSAFREEAPHLIEEVENDARHGDEDALESHAHALKGVARTVGAEPLAEVASTLEDEPSTDPDRMDDLLKTWEETKEEVDRVKDAVHQAS